MAAESNAIIRSGALSNIIALPFLSGIETGNSAKSFGCSFALSICLRNNLLFVTERLSGMSVRIVAVGAGSAGAAGAGRIGDLAVEIVSIGAKAGAGGKGFCGFSELVQPRAIITNVMKSTEKRLFCSFKPVSCCRSRHFSDDH